ncbi:PREDICTED: ankyrin repeat-containing protein NPR4-like [Nicotiana attenuata]|uniref:ankyrin repeat-containing protein NPR4-like n=1 Tax=Nicotiana attenuata TaxID=49451 RepID=UPI000904DB01|nr:PREDICTED: ankyrin repeat-containing protein NPR4-like [Nicotiana attenuata]
MHEETLDIVKCLCEELTKHYSSTGEDIEPVLRKALLSAAGSGISEIIEEIIERYPDAIWFVDSENHNLFHLAVINRYEKVFSLIYQLSVYKHLVTAGADTSGNNILHMAGKLAPLSRLNLISGAALQMQRELQWFRINALLVQTMEEVEKFVQPTLRTKRNSNGETPKMVFTEEHKELVKEGEKWMKETANSCIFVAALTTTVVFAAAITVPGGNNQNSGFPLFSNETRLLQFLLHSVCCLCSNVPVYPHLEISSSATIYLVFGQKKGWILIPVGIAALIPVVLFESLQFPLLLDMFMSTYGPSIFPNQSSRILH